MDFKNHFNKKYKVNTNIFSGEPMLIIKSAAEIIKNGKVLMLGVGNGRNASYLLQKNFEIIGVDVAEQGIKILRDNFPDEKKLKLITNDVVKVDFNEKFEMVTAIGLLHFLKKKEVDLVIKKMQNLTNKGGVNVIVVRMTQNILKNLPHIFKENGLKKYYLLDDWIIKTYKEIDLSTKKIAQIIAIKK